jgi:hypothetical protein
MQLAVFNMTAASPAAYATNILTFLITHCWHESGTGNTLDVFHIAGVGSVVPSLTYSNITRGVDIACLSANHFILRILCYFDEYIKSSAA